MTVPPGAPVVAFDHATAVELAAALDQLALELHAFARAAEAHAEVARQDWAGYSRRWFDHQLAALVEVARRSRGLAEDDRAAVDRARAWAEAEQQRLVAEALAAAAAEEARLAELAATPVG